MTALLGFLAWEYTSGLGREESQEQTAESPHSLGFAQGQLDKVLRMISWFCLTSKSITFLFVSTKYSVLMCVNLMYVAFAWQAVKYYQK